MLKKIKVLIMDVDGTLTDGSLYIGEGGEAVKRFHVRDGYAIKNLLPEMGIIPIVITGRKSEIVLRRCDELEIEHIVQESTDKVSDMKRILLQENIALEEAAYIGDDINDLACMKIVGLRACPNDAVQEVREIADYVTEKAGGNGAVREFVDWIRKMECYENSYRY